MRCLSISSRLSLLTLFMAAVLPVSALASCYTVYSAKGKSIFQSPDAPVDMRYELHDSVGRRFGTGATMVFTLANEYCPGLGDAKVSTTGPTSVYPPSVVMQPTVNARSIRSSNRAVGGAAYGSPNDRNSVVVSPINRSLN